MTEEDKNRDMLRDKQKTFIKTTMIGAINAFEKVFPELVGTDQFQELRDSILNLGNTQIRKSHDEFEKFIVSRRKYYVRLPIMKKD